MQVLSRLIGVAAGTLATLMGGSAALAQIMGQPHPKQLGLQAPATPVMEELTLFHDWLLVIISVITVFVLVLLLICMVRFNRRSNPTPSRTTHNTTLEVLWTVVPVLILLFIAFGPPMSSFRLLYLADRAPDATMTVKATGHQWFWTYDYPDNGNISITSTLNDKATPELRLLDTDTHILVPVNTKVRLLTTAEDVIHSWAMPSFGVKLDAVPGRINETWFEVLREGTYYGQCSELCGNGHGYMPIVVEAVSKEKFDAWVQQKKAELNGGAPATTVAAVGSSN
jgi:cytochrome c oxidase subunit II